MIHSSAHIDSSAEIDDDVSIGTNTVIGPNNTIHLVDHNHDSHWFKSYIYDNPPTGSNLKNILSPPLLSI